MARPYPHTLPPRDCRARGFALLITITLVAFLVLILISLAALTRVETQVASNSQDLNQARQNALMALNIAIGQLQKYAGPDQRVTTTADLVANEDKAGVAAPAALYAATPRMDVKPGSRYWTAAWGNTESNIRYDLRPNQIPPSSGPTATRRGVTPGLLNWLVSGNESATFTANGTLGGVTEGANITFTPGDAVDLSDLANPKVKNEDAVVLIGAHTVGTGVSAQQDYVVAPLMPIPAPGAAVPGLDPTAPPPIIGRYAWWVGDEGVKARINLQNGYQQTGQTGDQINSFLTAQRAAIEFMDRDPAGTPSPALIGSDYNFTVTSLPNVSTPIQLPLISTDPAVQTRLSATAKHRFHDITSSSFGVLSDTYAGGLKKDLTTDFADDSPDSSYRPADSDPIFAPISTAEAYLPTWGHLRTWARTHPDSSGQIVPAPASDANAGIGPVLQYAALGYDVRVNADRSISLAVFPVIALYNPYTVAIAPSRYDVGFKFSANSRMAIETSARTATPTWVRRGEIDWGALEVRPGNNTGTASEDIYFTVDDSHEIPPGESHIYYLSVSDTAYSAGQLLRRAPTGENANPLNYVYLNSSLVLDPEVIIDDPIPSGGDPNPAPTSHLLRILTAESSNSPGTVSSQWGGNAAPRVIVTLAAEGGIDNPDAWYQRSDIMTGVTGVNKKQVLRFDEAVNPGDFTMANADPLFRISKVENWSGETQGPRGAIRFCPRNSSGGDYNAADRTGMPQISIIWLRHSNFRAPYGQLSTSESAAPRGLNRRGNMLFGVVLANDNSSRKVALYPSANEFALSMAGSPDSGGNPSRYSTFFDILDQPESLLSLGQFQHAPLARYSFYSTYPFGNSMAELRIPRITHYRTNNVARPGGGATDPTYDLSWHLNRAIWDKYFLATAPADLDQGAINNREPLPNARLAYSGTPDVDAVRFRAGVKQAYDQAAANLLNAGSFNINSTSEQAWRAVLSGTYGIPQNNAYATVGDNPGTIIPFSRFSKSLDRPAGSGSGLYATIADSMVLDTTTSGPHNSATNFNTTFYHGGRGLLLTDPSGASSANDSAENLVKELARTMVEQVRARGPFLSLSDFVNRSMSSTTHELGIKGAIQTAIDTMENSQANPTERWRAVANLALNEGSFYQSDVSAVAYPDWDREHFIGGPTSVLTTNPERSAFRLQYAHAPKYLTQADVLSTIGPSLSPRSDTFTIRAYGEKRNPVTNEIQGRAWCEAVVQRTPDFVNDTNPSHLPLTDSTLTNDNRTFGRKFVIVSFRWLSPSEI